ncbi:MAG TPA: OB-fold domain-containing protein [Bryobacteraceae bacterium]|jgi:uncharacterized OB-fold protein|nr:OB-fold domain-containing protein [Bryobacteraceae bacterium]
MMTTTTAIPEPKLEQTRLGPGDGEVYTETVVWAAPQAYINEAPYQIAIITLDAGGRLTARIDGERVVIGDRVVFADFRNGVPFFRKAQSRIHDQAGG